MGKRPPGPGRPKGSPNKATARREKILAQQGYLPLQFLLNTMRNEENPFAVRMDAAKAAAPYVHPRLSQIQAQIETKAVVKHALDPRMLSVEMREALRDMLELTAQAYLPAIEGEAVEVEDGEGD